MFIHFYEWFSHDVCFYIFNCCILSNVLVRNDIIKMFNQSINQSITQKVSFKEINVKISTAWRRPFCTGLCSRQYWPGLLGYCRYGKYGFLCNNKTLFTYIFRFTCLGSDIAWIIFFLTVSGNQYHYCYWSEIVSKKAQDITSRLLWTGKQNESPRMTQVENPNPMSSY